MCGTDQSLNHLGLTDKNHACACATEAHGAATTDTQAQGADAVIREHYLVAGMTCSHCVASVTEEVSALAGVESVSVELRVGEASRIMVVSSEPVSSERVRDAVTTAGYTMVTG